MNPFGLDTTIPPRPGKHLNKWVWVALAILAGILLWTAAKAEETASYYTVKSCIKESGQFIMANGKELKDEDYTCAIWDYKFGTILKITNLKTGVFVQVTVTDRGPAKRLVKKGRIIDLSKAAFAKIADLRQGVIKVKVERI